MKIGILQATSAATLLILLASGAGAGATPPHRPGYVPSGVFLAADQTRELIDINKAPEESLRSLPGVGPARAQAIVAGRPYTGKDELVKRNVLPKNVYDGIKERIVARQK